MTDIAVHLSDAPASAERRAEVLAAPGFGKWFTDHMVTAQYSVQLGWHDAQLVPYGPISLDPSTSVLHYGQAIFEGFKAYMQPDGSLATFRPEANSARFNRSATRLAMPHIPEELFVGAADLLIATDREWVPTQVGEALYLRPLMFATDPFLGVRPSLTYTFLLFASPAGAYFTGGVTPVSVWLGREYVRAAPGGTGEAKCAGNYAASLIAQAEAYAQGCDQVVWLDAAEHRYVEEMGGMNLYFVIEENGHQQLVTPALTGSLLAGVTRSSLLALAERAGLEPVERLITTEEWEQRAADGTLTEVFACGTAAVVTPVGTVKHSMGEFTVGDGEPGKITMTLREMLLAIQHGQEPDTFGWMHPVPTA